MIEASRCHQTSPDLQSVYVHGLCYNTCCPIFHAFVGRSSGIVVLFLNDSPFQLSRPTSHISKMVVRVPNQTCSNSGCTSEHFRAYRLFQMKMTPTLHLIQVEFLHIGSGWFFPGFFLPELSFSVVCFFPCSFVQSFPTICNLVKPRCVWVVVLQ